MSECVATKDIRETFDEDEHARLKELKGDHTWREAIVAGCEVLASDNTGKSETGGN